MIRVVQIYVWLLTTVQLVTVIVLVWAMALEGPALLDCLSAFME